MVRNTWLPLVLLFLVGKVGPGVAADGAKLETDTETAKKVEALIDRLREVANPDFGYSPSVSGSIFLPLDDQGQVATVLLAGPWGGPRLQRSPAMRELVKMGAPAVPYLLNHLDDKRPTRMQQIVHPGGVGGMFVGGGACDYNPRTQKAPPERKDEDSAQLGLQTSYRLTVGDLCFVALGQIVNRDFCAVGYMPTATIIVSSPTRSAVLRVTVKDFWGGLTPERHKASLLDDLDKPDREDRRFGAARRLAYYYPEALEAPALKLLAQPTSDTFDVKSFTRKELYVAKDAKERKALFDAYLSRNGEPARDGILQLLFDDLEVSNDEFKGHARACLVQLYGKERTVTIDERPEHFAKALSASEKGRFIRETLTYDQSAKIDRAVRDLLASIKDDDRLAVACMTRLIGRGFDAEIERYCQGRLPLGDLGEMLGKAGWTRLHVAIERGRTGEVERLIRAGADAGAVAKNGQTPLHLAAEAGDTQSVKLLLDAKAPWGPKDRAGQTPVRLASLHDHQDVVQLLVDRGAAVSDILIAAAVGKADRVEEFLKEDPKLMESRNNEGHTALHLAAWRGHAAAVGALLAAKAPVDEYDYGGLTPLHLAVVGGHDAVVRLLIAHKAGVRTPVKQKGLEPLHLAALTGKRKVAEVLLDNKADVAGKHTTSGRSALHLAAGAGYADVVELLLARGATVDELDKGGWTPLHLAVEAGQRDMVALLLRHKADPAAKDLQGRTALDLAKENGADAILKLLREAEGKK